MNCTRGLPRSSTRDWLQEPLATLPYLRSRILGSLVLVDTASHQTSGTALVRQDLQ